MSELSNDSPRRYFVDGDGQRVMVGLTLEETSEFEALDSLELLNRHSGQVLWEKDRSSGTSPQRRWMELYAKHEQAWGRWMANSRVDQRRSLPILN